MEYLIKILNPTEEDKKNNNIYIKIFEDFGLFTITSIENATRFKTEKDLFKVALGIEANTNLKWELIKELIKE